MRTMKENANESTSKFAAIFEVLQKVLCTLPATVSCATQQAIVICHLPFGFGKVKVVPYTFVVKGEPVREDTYAEPSACEVGWPIPFIAAFISPVFPLGTHLLLGEHCRRGSLLEQRNLVPIHVKNLQLFMTEIYKTRSGLRLLSRRIFSLSGILVTI